MYILTYIYTNAEKYSWEILGCIPAMGRDNRGRTENMVPKGPANRRGRRNNGGAGKK